MNASSPSSYVPGYVWPKRLMIILGAMLFTAGLWQLRTPLELLFFGTRTTAEAIDVVETKPGLPDAILHSQAQLENAQQARDRSYVLWNEFRFEPTSKPPCVVRAPVGSLLKPLYPLLDDDGLPTTVLVWYDPTHPEIVTFPQIISVWFAPGALVLAGLLAIIIGSTLLYWARTPIPLPPLRDA
jgi:hypothetical protein